MEISEGFASRKGGGSILENRMVERKGLANYWVGGLVGRVDCGTVRVGGWTGRGGQPGRYEYAVVVDEAG